MNAGRTSLAAQEELIAMAFIMPYFLGVFIFMIIPLIYTFYLSFVDFNSLGVIRNFKFIGLDNYISVLKDSQAIAAYGRTLIYSLTYTVGIVVISLLLALLLNKQLFFRPFSRTLLFMPYVSNIMAIAIIWSVILDPFDGPVNTVLKNLGISNPPLWLGGTDTALFCVAAIMIWNTLPYQTTVFLAGLQQIPKDLIESAVIDGANTWRKFIHITLPILSPTTFLLIVTSFIGSTNHINAFMAITNGGPGDSSTIHSVYMYQMAFYYNKYSTATAISMIMFIFVLLVTYLQWKGQKKWVHY